MLVKNITCNLPLGRKEDFTFSLIQLYRISEQLHSTNEGNTTDALDSLRRIENLSVEPDVITLSRASLAFAIYRKLRAT